MYLKLRKTTRKPITVNAGVFRIADFGDFEQLCQSSARTWGVTNALYKDENENTYYLVLHKGRCSEESTEGFLISYWNMVSLIHLRKKEQHLLKNITV